MARIFLLLAIVLGVLWWLRSRAQARRGAERTAARPSSPPPGAAPANPEAMVQCAHCGVHVPQGEAIAWRGLHYCRRSHLPDMEAPDASQGPGAHS